MQTQSIGGDLMVPRQMAEPGWTIQVQGSHAARSNSIGPGFQLDMNHPIRISVMGEIECRLYAGS